jgi:hypothetical protein
MKAFKMEIRKSVMLEDMDKYESMVNSSRKIETIRFSLEYSGLQKNSHIATMEKIMEKFKADVKELDIIGHLSLGGFQLLSSMSRLQKLKLHGITAGKMNLPQSFRLRLPNLRELEISKCDSTVLGVLRPSG